MFIVVFEVNTGLEANLQDIFQHPQEMLDRAIW